MKIRFTQYLLAALLGVTFTTELHAQLPNAWQIDDHTNTASLFYNAILATNAQQAATNAGFDFSVNARFLTNFSGTKAMTMIYGLGNRRFLIWWNQDANGDLTAELEGGNTYTLTTNGTGATLYHTHEIIYDASTGKASYVFDGVALRTNWAGIATAWPAGEITWGSGSTSGQGQMNFHRVSFMVTNDIVAAYDAGTEPDNAPDPAASGWALSVSPPPANTSTNAITPDAVPLPTVPVATTLAATNIDPHQATLSGVVNEGNLAAAVWFEWGTDTNYGNITPPQALLSDTNDYKLTENLTGLIRGTEYHFRCVATNLEGIVYGEDAMFATPFSFVVNNLADSGSGSLRDRISIAEPGDIITFATNGTLTLASALDISKDLTITGPGPTNLAINGNAERRIFNISSASANVNISGLMIFNGHAPDGANGGSGGSGGKGGNGGAGGGIYSLNSLTLICCAVATNNTGAGGTGGAGGKGAGLSGNGGNGGGGGNSGNGGGVYGSGSYINCTFAYNSCRGAGWGGDGGNGAGLSGDGGKGGDGGNGGDGGGVYGSGSYINCTVGDNSTGAGGSGGNGGTFGSGGSAYDGLVGFDGKGGGIYSFGALTLNNTTLSGNATHGVGNVGAGGGIYNAGILLLTNSIVAGNTAYIYTNIYGSFSGANNLTSGDPQLAPLSNYGGPTQTMPPKAGSPAIDNGRDSVTNFLAADQRGYARRVGTHVDIGAVEYIPSLVVTTSADSGPGSLREVIPVVGWGGDVTFSNNLYGQTITLTSGELLVANDLTITGLGATNLAINGNGSFRIFEASANQVVILDSLTLTNGNAPEGAGVLVDYGATLTANNCVFSGNDGGGIRNYGTLTLNNSTVSGNSAPYGGGGIYIYQGVTTLNNSTVSGNSATNGGGIYNDYYGYIGSGTLALNNSTVSGNSATNGGGIYNAEGTLALNNSTVTGNSATKGGGIYNGGGINGGPLAFNNSIVAGNTAPTDPNVSGSLNGNNNLIDENPMLAPLGDYGGSTQTMAPLPGSPAIDAGFDIGSLPATDQRGFARVVNGVVDIGAVEAQVASAGNPPVLMNAVWSSGGGSGATFQFAFTNSVNIDFTALTSTNVALPLTNWAILGNAIQVTPGVYQFTDPGATNDPQRFYRVVSP